MTSHETSVVLTPESRESSPDLQLHSSIPAKGAGAAAIGWLAWQHRRQLLRAMGLSAVLSAAVALLLPNHYRSTVSLMPPDQNSSATSAMLGALTSKAGSSLGAMAGSMLNLQNSGDTVIGILHSRSVEDEIINRFDLRRVYWRKRYVDTRRILERKVDISQDHKSGIITIAVTDRSAKRATDMAQAYVDFLNTEVAQLTTTGAHRERVFLEGRLKVVKENLDTSSLALSRFSSRNRTLDLQTQGRAVLDAGASLQGRLIAAESDLRALQQIYSPDNPRVRSAQARVNDLRMNLGRMVGADATPDVEEKPTASGELSPSLTQLPLLANTYADLYRRTKILEVIYETLSQEYEIARVEEAKEIPSIKVLDRPMFPEKKSWPPRTLIVLLGTLAGGGFYLLWVGTKRMWADLEPDTPWRKLALDIFAEGKAQTATNDLPRDRNDRF
jgi:capsule polysaccharide export protein KpsE/RkpR